MNLMHSWIIKFYSKFRSSECKYSTGSYIRDVDCGKVNYYQLIRSVFCLIVILLVMK